MTPFPTQHRGSAVIAVTAKMFLRAHLQSSEHFLVMR